MTTRIDIDLIIKTWSEKTKERKTQKDLANVLEVDQMTISNWKKGRRLPTIKMLFVIEDMIKTDFKEFLIQEKSND